MNKYRPKQFQEVAPKFTLAMGITQVEYLLDVICEHHENNM